jgi:hypothetical protein
LYCMLPGRFHNRGLEIVLKGHYFLKNGEDCELMSSGQLNSETSLKWKTVSGTKLRRA